MTPKMVPLAEMISAIWHTAPADGKVEFITDAVMREIDPARAVDYLRVEVRAQVKQHLAPAVRGTSVSTKQAIIREQFWPAYLQRRVFLPDGPKIMAKLSPSDLRFLADQRRSAAAQFTFESIQFARLAEAMEIRQISHLEQLPAETGQRALEGKP